VNHSRSQAYLQVRGIYQLDHADGIYSVEGAGLDEGRLLESAGGMAAGCGADNRRALAFRTVRTLRRSKRESADSLKEMQILHRLAGPIQRSAIRKSFPIPIVTGRIIVRSVKPIVP